MIAAPRALDAPGVSPHAGGVSSHATAFPPHAAGTAFHVAERDRCAALRRRRTDCRILLAFVALCAVCMTLWVDRSIGAAERTLFESWEETLRFGIDSEIGPILDQIAQAGEEALDAAIVDRFRISRNEQLRTAIITHVTARKSPILRDHVRSLVLSDDLVVGDELLRVSTAYLSQVAEDRSPELLARYARTAERGSVLAATIAIEAIGRDGSEEAVDMLLGLYGRLRGVDQRAAVLRALGHSRSDEALPLLTMIAADEFEESALRHYATESIGRIAAPESMSLLASLLASTDGVLRAYAVLALGFYATDEAGSHLEEALLDSFWRVRVAALRALGEQRRMAAVPAVAYKARRDPEAPVRLEAIRTLGSIDTEAGSDILRAIARNERTPVAERTLALEQLVRSDAVRSRDLIEELITVEWGRENSRVLDVIGRLLSEHAVPQLDAVYGRLLMHPSPVIRIYGMRAIGKADIRSRVDDLKAIARTNPAGIEGRAALASLNAMGVDYDP
jgi:HEAT repeat protein